MRTEREIAQELLNKYAEIAVNLTKLATNLGARVDFTLPVEKFLLDDSLKADRTIGYYYREYEKGKRKEDSIKFYTQEIMREQQNALQLALKIMPLLPQEETPDLRTLLNSLESDFMSKVKKIKELIVSYNAKLCE